MSLETDRYDQPLIHSDPTPEIKHIGFTGTRKGMTKIQYNFIRAYLSARNLVYDVVAHHGDCVGADKDFHDICRDLGVASIIGHPPTKMSARAFCDFDHEYKPQAYLRRNQSIVNDCEIIIATPDGPERIRSGTWSTIRYARKHNKNVLTVLPDGKVEYFETVKLEEPIEYIKLDFTIGEK